LITHDQALKMDKWSRDPVLFVREVFGAEPDEWQKDALRSLIKPLPRLCMQACKGPGKSTVLAWSCWWYICTHHQAQIYCCSITEKNLNDGLWKELSLWRSKSKLIKELFTWNKTSIIYNQDPSLWYMQARQFSKSASADEQADTLAGKHAPNMLFVLDEAGNIPIGVLGAAEAALANEGDQRILIAGNTTSLRGALYRASVIDRKLWCVIEVTSAPDDPKRTPRVRKEWAEQEIKRWGWDHPYVKVNIRGVFPDRSINTLLGPNDVSAAENRVIQPHQYNFSQKRLGIDAAGFGDDSWVIFPRQGLAAFKFKELKGTQKTEVIGATIMQYKRKFRSEFEFVDCTGGYGDACVEWLENAGQTPIRVVYSTAADNPMYLNKRSEMYFRMADWIKKGGCIPKDPELYEELINTHYYYHKDRFQIEPKDKIKEVIGRSPNKADALAQTFFFEEMPGNIQSLQNIDDYGINMDNRQSLRANYTEMQEVSRHSGNMDMSGGGMKTDYDHLGG